MKRKIFLFLTVVTILFVMTLGAFSITANAVDNTAQNTKASSNGGKCGKYLTWTLNDGTLSISGTGFMDTYMTSSSAPWYNVRTSIRSIKISYGVNDISSYAFYNCSNLTSVTIPDSVMYIGVSAFENCSSLKEITLPFVGDSEYASSGTNHFGYIFGACDEGGFTGLSGYERNNDFVPGSLKKVTITSAKSIADNAFYNCRYITSIILPESITSIGFEAFYNCNSLKSIVIPAGVKNIYDFTFFNCINLTSAVIADSVKSIGEYAFAACPSSLTIYAHANTYAESYAKAEGISFAYFHEYDSECDDKCNFCGDIRNVPHALEWIIDKPNNCSVDGIKHGVCNLCQAVLYENTVIPATGEHTLLSIKDKKCDVCEEEVILLQYNGNDGVTITQIWLSPNESTTIPYESPVRNGYNFVGWSTTKGGDVEYQAGDTLYSLSESLILYAQWNKRCASCGGDGIISLNCSQCHNSGSYTDDCGSCNGEGGRYVFTSTCTKCSGSGMQCGSCGRGLSALNGKCSYCGSNTVNYCKRCGGSGGDKQWRTCTSCSGSGSKTYTCTACPSSYKCTTCSGTGEVIRTSVSAPSTPIIELIECNTIVLKAITNGEYSMDGINWQDSPVFENLEPETQYLLYQRYAKTETTYRSEGRVILINTSKHQYDNTCDSDCNYCNELRTAFHSYDGKCDNECNICYDVRVSGVAHTNAAAVVESKVDATCITDGSYDSVVYCSVCEVEILRESKKIEASGHTYSVWESVDSNQHQHACTCGNVEIENHIFDGQGICTSCNARQYTPGDVDGNESVDKNDAIYLLMHSFFPEDYPINQEADYNGNGIVDKDDAIHLLMYTFFPDDYPLD